MLSGIELTGVFGDVVFLAIVVAFFALAALFVKACDRIAGPDPSDLSEGGSAAETSPDAELDLVEVTA